MSSAPSTEEIARDATWLAQALDPAQGMLRLVAMDRDSYRAAGFLDDRLMQHRADSHIVPWAEVEAAITDELRSDARWIFHIGHVGSTLVSRLLGEIENVLALREPRILRDLAVTPSEVRARYLRAVPRLMSRTFDRDAITCVKATSFAGEIAAELVPTGERALFMYATPRNYVASILAGENSVRELHALEAYRGQRLAARSIQLAPPRTDAERAAIAWACEMTTLESAVEAMSDRSVEWADFDTMLQDMAAALARVAAFFGFAAAEERLSEIVGGPLMRRYSKDTSYDYSPRLREELIQQELRIQGRDIEAALAMLRAASERSEILARALKRAEGK